MLKKSSIFLFMIFCFFICGCSHAHVAGKINNPPIKSFVKILHTTEVKSCVDPKDKKCPKGIFIRSGSGIVIDLEPGEMTVLTAGHVCDSSPTKAIKEVTQTIEVMDHTGKIHQAWPILVSHNNQKGSGDLCLLWVPTLKTGKVKFSLSEPKVGDELFYMGAPAGIYHPPTVPIFKGIYSGIIDPSSAMLTVPGIGGSSGAGILNHNHEIVGVLWGANSRFHHISVITSHKSFIVFLRMAKGKIKNKN